MLALILAASLLSVPFDEDSIGWVVHPTEATVAAGRPFEAVALSWSEGSSARVRASADGITWTEWQEPALDDDLSDGSESRFQTGIVHFGSAQTVLEYDAPGAKRVKVIFFAPPPSTQALAASPSSIRLGDVTIRSRYDWGCPEPDRQRSTPSYTVVTHAIVHHTAGANSVPDWDAEMRNVWFLHVNSTQAGGNGWADIGYNYLIAPNGVIYEGRFGGPGVLGAHFSCVNGNTVGVALLGTYSNVAPTQAAVDSLRALLRELSRLHKLDLSAVAVHESTGGMLPVLSGHRDDKTVPKSCFKNTDCPGNFVYALLPELRTTVVPAPAPTGRRRAVTR